MKQIPLRARDGSIRAHALVDDDVFEQIGELRWCLDGDGYAVRTDRRDGGHINFRMHRVILGLENGNPLVADHRNGDRLDNRRANLRAVTLTENNQRRRPRSSATTRSRGVHRLKSNGKYQASVRFRDRLLHLGTWDTEEEAAQIAAAVRGALMPYSVEGAEPCAA